MKAILYPVLALALAGVAAPVSAEVYREPIVLKVSTAGVNFSDPADVRRFYGRLRAASRKACASGATHDLLTFHSDQKCQKAALNQAVTSLNQPMLTAMLQQGDAAGVQTVAAQK